MFENFIENLCKSESLMDVASYGEASQSSFSHLSKENDAQRAINGTIAIDYSFHTGKEKSPWWQVEFESDINPHYIIINNRRHEKWFENSAPIEISVVNEKNETIVIHKGLLYFGSLPDSLPLIMPLAGKLKIKKIILKTNTGKESYIHLTSINILVKRYSLPKLDKPLFFANRVDGFGMRICAIMIAMVYAKEYNGDFFFSWYTREGHIYENHHITNSSKDIFNKSFIEDHVVMKSEIDEMSLIDVSDFDKNFSYKNDGYLCDYKNLKDVSPFKKVDSFYNVFESLLFSDKLIEAKRIAEDVDLERKSVAIHIRSGDLVYEHYRFFHTFHYKVTPVFIIPTLIEKYQNEGYDVILFGQEEKLSKHLCSKYSVKYSKEFIPDSFDSSQLGVFDITLMSKVSLIISMGSAFTKVANLVGNNKVVKYNDVLTEKQIFESFNKSNSPEGLLFNNVVHDLFKSFSYINFFKRYKNTLSLNKKLEVIERCIFLEPDNQLNKLLKNLVLLDTVASDKANKEIIDLFLSSKGYSFLMNFTKSKQSLPGMDYIFKEYIPEFKVLANKGFPSAALIYLMHEKVVGEDFDMDFYNAVLDKAISKNYVGYDLLRNEIEQLKKKNI